jgi:PKD repeat protein
VEVFDNPSAAFNLTTVCEGTASEFFSTSSAPASAIDTWLWEMDGTTYNTENTEHIFSSNGNFDVTLIVETDQGCSDNITQPANVYDLPIAEFSYFNPCRSNVVEITNSSSTAPVGNSPITDYFWNFNNGETSDTTAAFFKYIYPGAGDYTYQSHRYR